eukprot:196703_1
MKRPKDIYWNDTWSHSICSDASIYTWRQEGQEAERHGKCIVWKHNGYGFVRYVDNDGKLRDAFVHCSNLNIRLSFLHVGALVTFDVMNDDTRGPYGINVNLRTDIKCQNCNGIGHRITDCASKLTYNS